MVAAVLHLQEGAGAAFDAVHRVRRRRVAAMMSPTSDARAVGGPDSRIELFFVAEDAVDLGHGGEDLRLGLRRAAGDDDARVRGARA